MEKLVLNLAKQGWEKFIYLQHYIENEHSDFIKEKLKLLMCKGMYSYEYMDIMEKFGETHLLQRLDFYSSIEEQGISEAYYDHVQSDWRTFQMSNLGD